ncbi:hypothetical protein LTR08_000418 [Meristemomyces frigidus]|nr:hypothetical protein LTR08_000418 [Meristemomyces frigidus]
MACDTATNSPYPESLLSDTWGSKDPETTELDAIAEFNAAFGGDSNSIDPQMLSNPSSPASSFTTAFNAGGLDQTMSPEPNAGLGAYPTDFATSGAPYYHSSFELHATSPFQPSSLRYQSRQRSVSEPPDGYHIHRQQVQSGPQMTFHRNGHWLGPDQQARPLKSLPKNKGVRSQPYKCKPNLFDHREQPQSRYQLRRTQTQPVRPPMSVPAGSMSPHHLPTTSPHPMAHLHSQQLSGEPLPTVMEGQRYVTSRVCTPTPELPPPAMMPQSPVQQIDPLLMMPLMGGDGQAAVTVPLTVEQLRVMIMEAVQNAVKGLEGGKSEELGAGPEVTMRDEKPLGGEEQESSDEGTARGSIEGEDIVV